MSMTYAADKILLIKNTTCKQVSTVKLGDKEQFDKEQIGVKEPFPMTNLPIYFIRTIYFIRNPSIYNIERWVTWMMGQTNRQPSV